MIEIIPANQNDISSAVIMDAKTRYVDISIKKEVKWVSFEKLMAKYCSIKRYIVFLLHNEIFQSILVLVGSICKIILFFSTLQEHDSNMMYYNVWHMEIFKLVRNGEGFFFSFFLPFLYKQRLVKLKQSDF